MSRASALLEADVKSVPALVEAKRIASDAMRFRDQVRGLSSWATVDLLPRLETTQDPLMLWALHLELERRDIPPCLRVPKHSLGPQGDYLTLAADVHWLQKHTASHQPAFRGWKDVLRSRLCSAEWHRHVHRQFLYAYPRGLAHVVAKGLALDAKQRQQLSSVPTTRMVRERACIEGRAFNELLDCLHRYASAHPDRSGQHKPEAIARRRAFLYRVYVLSGKSPTLTADYWTRLTSEHLSRQAVAAHIDAVKRVIN